MYYWSCSHVKLLIWKWAESSSRSPRRQQTPWRRTESAPRRRYTPWGSSSRNSFQWLSLRCARSTSCSTSSNPVSTDHTSNHRTTSSFQWWAEQDKGLLLRATNVSVVPARSWVRASKRWWRWARCRCSRARRMLAANSWCRLRTRCTACSRWSDLTGRAVNTVQYFLCGTCTQVFF